MLFKRYEKSSQSLTINRPTREQIMNAILKKIVQLFDVKTLLFLFLILFLFYHNDQKLTKIESEMKQLTEVTNQSETNKPKPLNEIVQMGSLTKNIIELQNN